MHPLQRSGYLLASHLIYSRFQEHPRTHIEFGTYTLTQSSSKLHPIRFAPHVQGLMHTCLVAKMQRSRPSAVGESSTIRDFWHASVVCFRCPSSTHLEPYAIEILWFQSRTFHHPHLQRPKATAPGWMFLHSLQVSLTTYQWSTKKEWHSVYGHSQLQFGSIREQVIASNCNSSLCSAIPSISTRCLFDLMQSVGGCWGCNTLYANGTGLWEDGRVRHCHKSFDVVCLELRPLSS